jgi:hypothetical protein
LHYGQLLHDFPEPPHRADVALARRSLLDLQDTGRLRAGQLLEVPQGDHLAVNCIHGVERLLEPEGVPPENPVHVGPIRLATNGSEGNLG